MLRLFLLVLLLSLIAVLSAFAGMYVAVAGNLPELGPEYQAAQTTKIFTDGENPVLLAELHGVEDREIVPGEQIPQHMRDAVVAEEDRRFYEHQGVDFLGILRALLADLRQGEIVQGGSTITQQYIKNAYITSEKTLDRKVKEAALAYQLEKEWSKERILNEYLNTIYFGEGAYGVEAAAQEYFGKHASDLSHPEAALLAAIPKSPANYSPRRDPEAAQSRRDMILNKMFQQGYLNGSEVQTALATDIALVPSRASESTKQPYWVEFIREQLVAKYGSNQVLQGGLRVYTSIDLEKQEIAEDVIADILDEPGDPEASLVSLDLKTGRILAMVGGRDFATQKFNIATQGQRQPGSAFKTFVLVTALKEGIPPSRTYESGPITLELPGDDWNVKSKDEGEITLAEATADSVNGTYARLIMEVGAEKVVETAERMGVETALRPDPAIALGGLRTGVNPLEMAVAYATLGSGGYRLSGTVVFDPDRQRFPIAITRVTDAAGHLLDENRLVRTPVLDPRHAYITTDVLKGVIEHGTAEAADIGRPAAGKTGTTQVYRDAWFVGYTPEVVTAVWVGHRDTQTEMTNVHGIKVTGGTFPAQIWAEYMKRALEGVPPSDFAKPEGTEWVTVKINPESGLLATSWCPETVEATFLKGSEPMQRCDVHGPKEVSVPDVVGKSLEQARRALAELRLEVEVLEESDEDSSPGTVLSQNPRAGNTLLQGRVVTLTTAKAPPAGTVPDVVGESLSTARAELKAAGYEVAEQAVADEAAVGQVVSQQPPGGSRLAAGGLVTLMVSSGPGQTTTTVSPALVKVPDVVGLSLQRAATTLRDAGLQASVARTVPADQPALVGTVAGQSPVAGTSVAEGSKVALTIYERPQ